MLQAGDVLDADENVLGIEPSASHSNAQLAQDHPAEGSSVFSTTEAGLEQHQSPSYQRHSAVSEWATHTKTPAKAAIEYQKVQQA